MKYLCILCILLCLSCGKTENFQTSKAEKWILLENAYLFQEKESIDKISKLRASIQRQQFLRNELAMKEEKEWEETYFDFLLDCEKILEAIAGLSRYQVLQIETTEQGYIEYLDNDMEIELRSSSMYVRFPKEESQFRLEGKLNFSGNSLSSFQGFEAGGVFTPKEAELNFLLKSPILFIYDSPLSDRTWEKICLLSLEYCNQSLVRNHRDFVITSPQNLTVKVERKIYE